MSGLPIAAAGMAGLVAKATLVLSLALLLAWLARRGSARTLHMLWTTTFVLLLALPALSLLGPSWTVPILPARDNETGPWVLEGAAGQISPAEAQREFAGSPASSTSPRELAGSMAATGSFIVDPRARHSGATFSAPPSPAAIAFLIWALGCVAALISLGVGALRFRKLARQASPLGDPAWLRQTDTIRRRLGVTAGVRLLSNARIPTPMTGGLRKPVILLPSSAETWSPERRAVVLAHELVHIRRRDALRQIVGCTVVALYWFHPLSWMAWRLATIASERSCDEEVLALGARPSEYARHLFSLASEVSAARAVLALPLVQRSQLESRIMSILRQNRPGFSRVRATAAMVAIGAAGILAACADPVPRSPAAPPSLPVEMTVPGDPPADNSPVRVPGPEPTPQGNPAAVPAAPATPVSQPGRIPSPTPVSQPVPQAVPVPDPGPQAALVPDPAPAWPVPETIGLQELECARARFGLVRTPDWSMFQTSMDGIRICLRAHRAVAMTDDGTAIESMEADSWLVLETEAERLHRLVITSGPGGLEHDWSIDGSSRPFDEEARGWRDLVLTAMGGYRKAQEVRGQEGSLRRQIGSHERHVGSLRRQIGSHERHVASLGRQIGSHERHVASLGRQIGSHERHVASLRRQIATQERHVVSLRRQLASAGRTPARLASLHQRTARSRLVEMQEALQTTTRALEQLDSRELESAAQALVQETDEVRLRELDGDVRQMVEDALRLRVEIQNEVGAQFAELQVEAVRMESELRSVRLAIEEYDLDLRVREIEGQIEQYDLDGKILEVESQIGEYDLDGRVRNIESQIDEYDLGGKIRDIESQIEAYDLDGKILEIEQDIAELDADRRADDIMRSLEDEIAALRRLIG